VSDPQDAPFIAAFFDGNLDDAYGACRTTWLPDATSYLSKLGNAVLRSDMHDVMFACDHLREGALYVGARTLLKHVKFIECAARDRDWSLASLLALEATCYVDTVRGCVGERIEPAAG
jgi:hypothetical protein